MPRHAAKPASHDRAETEKRAHTRRLVLRSALACIAENGVAEQREQGGIDPLKLPPRESPNEPHRRWRVAPTEERLDDAADPGEYVRKHSLERETDTDIVNEEAVKYS